MDWSYGLPAMIFLKDEGKAMKVGIGMVSRGRVGLIIAGPDVSAGALSADIYTTVLMMVAVTTIITPIWLKIACKKGPSEPPATTMVAEKET
jgi:Kef-type K+ transport system membrane component KefB